MGFFDNLKSKATDLAQAGVAQSKRLAEIARLKTANLGEEDTIKKAYLEIGKLYYAERGFAPEGAYAAACEKITAAKAATAAPLVAPTHRQDRACIRLAAYGLPGSTSRGAMKQSIPCSSKKATTSVAMARSGVV